jgi:hypothetical protein
MPPRIDERLYLRTCKKGSSINLHQYYAVLRIYLEVLQVDPDVLRKILPELYRCLEADWRSQLP